MTRPRSWWLIAAVMFGGGGATACWEAPRLPSHTAPVDREHNGNDEKAVSATGSDQSANSSSGNGRGGNHHPGKR
jgi:hypothetical protein